MAGISKNITTAIEAMGADRIGHGLQAVEDPRVIDLLVRTETPLELCPTSNWLTGACEGLHAHPIKELFNAGVHTTINNTDDPRSWLPTLIVNFSTFMSIVGWTLQRCNSASIGHGRTASSPGEKRCRGRHHERASIP